MIRIYPSKDFQFSGFNYIEVGNQTEVYKLFRGLFLRENDPQSLNWIVNTTHFERLAILKGIGLKFVSIN